MPVVAAVDRSAGADSVLAEGRRLAEAYGVPLHVVHVLSQSAFLELERTSVERSGRAVPMDRVREVAREIAADAAAEAEGGPEVEAVGLVGDAAGELVRYAADHDAEYVVLGGRKRSPVGKALFGSVTQSVLLDADRPVVAVMHEGG